MTLLEERFTNALRAFAAWPDKAVGKWCAFTLIRDQGPRVGLPPTRRLLSEIPALSPQQQGEAGWLINDALQSLKDQSND